MVAWWRGFCVAGLVVVSSVAGTTSPRADEPRETLSWLATGDSYSAGEGVADPEPIPTLTGGLAYPGREDGCAQVPAAWGPAAADLLREQFTVEPLVFSACSGSVIKDFYVGSSGATSLWEWSKQQGLPTGGRFDIVSMTFGGNDVGFSDVLRDCLPFFNPVDPANILKLPLPSFDSWSSLVNPGIDLLDALIGDCAATKEALKERITKLGNNIDFDQGPPGGVEDLPSGPLWKFYKAVLDRHVTSRGHIVVLGYPHLFANPRTLSEEGEWAPSDIRCAGITPAGATRINGAIDDFNGMLLEQVEKADPRKDNIHFLPVDNLWRNGQHELCGNGDDWLNGFSSRRLGKASFHPNELGYAAEAKLVAEFVRGLPWPSPPCPEGSECIAEMTADLDGDKRPDRIGLYLTGEDKFARAVLATGDASTLALPDGSGGAIGAPVLAVEGVADVDADGRDEAFIRTNSGGNTFWPVGLLKLDGKRLLLLGEPSESDGTSFLVDVGLYHKAGFRCGPAGSDGVPRITATEVVVESPSESDPVTEENVWMWKTREYRWQGAGIVLERSDEGRITGPPDDPRLFQYAGINCEGLPRYGASPPYTPGATTPEEQGEKSGPDEGKVLDPREVSVRILRAVERGDREEAAKYGNEEAVFLLFAYHEEGSTYNIANCEYESNDDSTSCYFDGPYEGGLFIRDGAVFGVGAD